jgi:hypothetical protein
MSVRHLILQHLVAGMNQQEAARAVGVTAGLVSQLLADPDFKAEVAKEKAERAEVKEAKEDITFSPTQLDGTYDSLEMAVLGKLGNMIAKENYPWRPAELAGIVKTLNSARRRTGPLSSVATPQSQVNVTNTVVQLNLPAAMQKTYLQPDFVIDPGKNQVIEVNGRRLDTLNSRELLNASTAEQRKTKLLAAAMAHSNNIQDTTNEDPYNTSAAAPYQAPQTLGAFSTLASRELNELIPSELPLKQQLLPEKLRGLTADDF